MARQLEDHADMLATYQASAGAWSGAFPPLS